MLVEKHWKIGELAKLTGLTIRTLRYYDQIGLYSPSGYSNAGYRLYRESDISRLHQILALKDLGLSLDEIKSILSDADYDPYHVVSMQIDRLKEKMKTEQKLLKHLQNVSNVLENEESLTVEDFTTLLHMMKQSHETHFSERRMSLEHQLDKLGDLFNKQPRNEPKGRNRHE